MRIAAENLRCGYGRKAVVHDVSLAVESGEVLCMLGANGSGKTTLFKTLLGFIPPLSGTVLVDGGDVRHWPRRRFAETLAYVPQAHIPPFPFTVREVVLTARAAHLGSFSAPGKRDEVITEEALEGLGLTSLANQPYTEISGGERQLVLIARALAQQPRFLLLDEPTSNLDFGNQIKVLRHLKELSKRGLGLLMTTHVPNHVFLCGTKVALLKQGRLVALGKPEDVMTETELQLAYGVPLRIAEVEQNLRVVVPRMN